MNIDDGGSAFPCGYHPKGNSADVSGLSLRDYFAAKAMLGILSGEELRGKLFQIASEGGLEDADPDDAEYIAARGVSLVAYNIADAMLEARKEAK